MIAKSGRGYSLYVLLVLLAVYSINYMDRQIIAVLSPQIKVALNLSDTELGLLKGTAFALFYSTMSVPLAMLGDRTNRVTLISCALALWSAMTALCGLATSFVQLFLIRMAVGVGEAGSTPSSHSLLADYFAREKRSTALATYSLGVPIGTLLGLLLGGWLAANYGWRWTLILLGVPGVAMAVMVKATVRELPRGSAEISGAAVMKPDGFRVVARLLWGIGSYRTMVLAGSLNALVGYALSMWMVDFYVRTEGLTLDGIAFWVAIAFGIGGGVGTLLGGLAADRFGRKTVSAYLTIPGGAMIVAAPLVLVAVLTGSFQLSIACLFLVNGLMYSAFGPLYGLVQTLTPVNNRALAIAFFFLFQSLIGAGAGPLTVGLLSDLLSGMMPPAEALTIALAVMSLPLFIAGLVLCIRRGHLKHDLAHL